MSVAYVFLQKIIIHLQKVSDFSLQRFGLTFHIHISNSNASGEQPFDLPTKAVWATFTLVTTDVCCESECVLHNIRLNSMQKIIVIKERFSENASSVFNI